jgi:hypothetical protein
MLLSADMTAFFENWSGFEQEHTIGLQLPGGAAGGAPYYPILRSVSCAYGVADNAIFNPYAA